MLRKLYSSFAIALAIAVSSLSVQAQTGVVSSLQNVSNKAATYAAATSMTLAATPDLFWTITGSATKTVYVKEVTVSCTMTTAGTVQIELERYSTAATGGTAVAVTETQLDSGSSAPTATVQHFTADPTQGTTAGVVAMRMITLVAPATASASQAVTFSFGDSIDSYLVLRGTSEQLGLDFEGATTTGGVCNVSAVWIEQ